MISKTSSIETKPPHISSVNRKHLSLSYLQTKIMDSTNVFFRNHPRNLQQTKKCEISLLPGCLPISPKHNNNKFLTHMFSHHLKTPCLQTQKEQNSNPHPVDGINPAPAYMENIIKYPMI